MKQKLLIIICFHLKNNHGFNPKIFTLDFNKDSCNAIKTVFPNIYNKMLLSLCSVNMEKYKKIKIKSKRQEKRNYRINFKFKKITFY